VSELKNIINDLRAQGEELYTFLETIDNDDWSRKTTFKNWTINDVVQHLYFGDYLGVTSHKNSDAFLTFMKEVQASGLPLVQYTRQWLNDESGPKMLNHWHNHFIEMCDRFAASDPDMRLTWAGPDMGLKMFATARLMETWAHSWEIYDLLTASPEQSDRIRHIATIGVKTYGWTFANRKLEPPGPPPYIKLTAPSGDTWEWNTPQDDNQVVGEAVEFCQVVTQVRNIADTNLKVRGEPAKQWMSIAQCFAGPPEDPPKPGTRSIS
jgi:uncharacterized protein (TIGR03084 family)